MSGLSEARKWGTVDVMKALSRCSFFFAALLAFLAFGDTHSLEGAEGGDIKGAWINRADGSSMNLLVEKNNFELHFYDEKGQSVEPDAAQAIVHYTSRIVQARETLVLLPVSKDENVILTSPRGIRPPFQFEILLVLNFDEAEKKAESHHVIFMQEAE